MGRLPKLFGSLEYPKNRLRYKAPPDLSRLSQSNGNHANKHRKHLMLEIEAVIVHDSGQMFADLKFSRHDSPLHDQLRGLVLKARPFQTVHLLLHYWLGDPLNPDFSLP